MFDAALIDLYDTLAFSGWWYDEFRNLAAELDVSEEILRDSFESTYSPRGTGAYRSAEGDLEAVARACGRELDPAVVREITARRRAVIADGVHLYDDSIPTLRGLRARGVSTAIVSNCDHLTRAVVDALGLDQEADAVILSFEVGALKPDPAIYRAGLDRLGAAPERSVFVDDQAPYCDGARELGLDTRLIMRPEAEPFEGFAADANGHRVIGNLRALLGDLVV